MTLIWGKHLDLLPDPNSCNYGGIKIIITRGSFRAPWIGGIRVFVHPVYGVKGQRKEVVSLNAALNTGRYTEFRTDCPPCFGSELAT